jgi:RsmE family RNA methyltransferase
VNLVLLEAEDFISSDRVCLRGRRAAYVIGVHRAGVGDALRVGAVNGRVGRGTVVRLAGGEVEMEVHLDAEPPPPLPVTLVLALPRPKVTRRVLQTVAAMGVKRLVLLNAWRVEKSFWESPVLAPESIREQLLLGLEQARDTILPEVSLRRRFKPFVEDELGDVVRDTLALVAHPPAAAPCPRAVAGPLTLAVGSEGGFIAYEIEALAAAGFAPVSLGPRILRVEQAVTALLARVT